MSARFPECLRHPALLAALVALALGGAAAGGKEDGPSAVESASPEPVLVELFTSQGCSSCPPADRLLAALAEDPSIVPLAFHVDYWNYIGWTDPFSAGAWSDRQRRYARRLAGGSVYTPQLVVNGAQEGLGSDPRVVENLIGAARAVAGRTRIDVEAKAVDEDRLAVRVVVEGLSDAIPSDALVVYVAVYENGLVTLVDRGENARRTLTNEAVVRMLVPVLELTAPFVGPMDVDLELGMAREWHRPRLGVAAFVQDPRSLRVVGAARTDLRGV